MVKLRLVAGGIPILLYYFYKNKTTRKEKEKKIKDFVKYVKVNTKKM